jgi:hypothetical protein
MARIGWCVLGPLLVVYGVLQVLGRRAGSTPRSIGRGGTRLQQRVRGRTSPGWLTATYLATIIPADYIMAGGMLRGIKTTGRIGRSDEVVRQVTTVIPNAATQ